MNQEPEFDRQLAHRHFAVSCFNSVWTLIDQEHRTPQADEEMIRLAQTSLWHWTQREDCEPRHLSVGYWQLSRVHALVNRPELARHYGELCLQHSANEGPFYLGFAHEALARAAQLAGQAELVQQHLSKARDYEQQVADADDRQLLTQDLDQITISQTS